MGEISTLEEGFESDARGPQDSKIKQASAHQNNRHPTHARPSFLAHGHPIQMMGGQPQQGR
jgi:hypothetical protein